MSTKKWVIHPVLFSIYPILFYYSYNIGQASPTFIIKPLAITTAAALSVWWFLRLIVKDWHRSGGIVSLCLLLFFSYGHAKTNINIGKEFHAITIMWTAVLLLGVFVIIQIKDKFSNITKILNVISLVLVIMVVVNICMFHARSDMPDYEYLSAEPKNKIQDKPQVYPDIYYIILDAYGREDVLKGIYNFDNSDFLDFLDDSGFYVADQSFSNYCQTSLSLGSCLNMTYLDDFIKKIGDLRTDHKPLQKLVHLSSVRKLLKDRGYKIVSFNLGHSAKLQSADVYIGIDRDINKFQSGLKNLTPLPELMKKSETTNKYDLSRKKTLYAFDSLGCIPSLPDSPKFVFAHIRIPHPPFVFGANGEPVQLESRFDLADGSNLIKKGRLSHEDYITGYRDQLIFCNKKIKESIKNILSTSQTKPVIILMGDHGPRSGLFWKSSEKTNVSECMSILNAYYLPDGDYSNLHPEISPVNSFRVILNQFFGTNYKLLQDKSYFSTARHPYKVYDVTARVRDEK